MKKGISKKIIIINFCIAAILVLIAGSMAAYTSLSSAKRVVSTTGTNQLFSSNVLYSFDKTTSDGKTGSPSTRVMSFSADGSNNTFKFTICNYAQGDKTAWATKNIDYTLTINLIDSKGANVTDTAVLSEYKLGESTFAELVDDKYDIVLNNTLVYDSVELTEDEFTITVSTKYMDKYKIKIVAEATTISNYSPIGRIISATASSTSTHWSGTFTDAIVDSDDHKPSELGSINTRISGRENEIMVITWDTSYVEIDPWFLEDIKEELEETGKSPYELSGGDASNPKKTLRFEVGGEGQPNQYYISFYRTTSAKTLDETWSDMEDHIEFSVENITAQ